MGETPDNIVPITTEARSAAEKFGAEHARELLTILFTDLVDSTKLQSDLGNVEAARLTELHRKIVRDELAKYDAREIEWAGDSCLAVFTRPSDGVVFALKLQAALRDARESEPMMSRVRIGLHLGEIVVGHHDDGGKHTEDLFGLQVSEAARVMSLARGDQIYCTRAVFDNARSSLKGHAIEGLGPIAWRNYGLFELKGSDDPAEVCEAGEEGFVLLTPPEANDKCRPIRGDLEKWRKRRKRGVQTRRGIPAWSLAAIAIVAMGAGLLLGKGLSTSRAPRAVSDAPIRSLAVLPFDNLMGDETKEYFVDGMTDTLTAELSKIASIKVIARTSAMKFKHSDEALSEIARQLGVDGLIEGSVQQFENEIRITAQLIDGRTEEHLWGENFEGTLAGVMKLQGKVAVSIADQIGAVLTPEARDYASAKDVNPEAYDLYLQGRSIMQSRLEQDFRIAINLFEKAISLDPEFALPHSGMADVYSLMRYFDYASGDEAKELAFVHARKAIELDDSLAEAHASLGFAYALFDIDRNWAASERAFQRAIELNPGFVRVRTWHGWLLAELGRYAEALREMRVATELDPLDPIALGALGRVLRLSQRYEEAEEALLAANVMDPLLSFRFDELSRLYQSIGRIDDALQAAQKVYDITKTTDAEWNVIFLGAALKGPEALRSLVAEVERGEHDEFSPRILVNLYLAVGDDTTALTYIQDNILSSYKGAMRVRSTEEFHSLEADPRDRRYLDDDPRFWKMLDKYTLPPLPPEHPRYAKEQAYLRQKAAEAALAAQRKPVRRYDIVLPTGMGLPPRVVSESRVTVSPDGTEFLYQCDCGDSHSQLVLRPFGSREFRVLPGTEDARDPFYSPDGAWVDFWTFADRNLKRIRMVDGRVEIVLEGIGTWLNTTAAENGDIFFTEGVGGQQTIFRLNPSNGEREEWLRTTDPSASISYSFPSVLPGDRRLLVTSTESTETSRTDRVAVIDIATKAVTVLPIEGQRPRYVGSGHLLVSRPGALIAVPFDLETLTVQGPAVDVTEADMTIGASYPYDYGVGHNGTLVYARSGVPLGGAQDLVAVTLDGAEEIVSSGDLASIAYPRVSPDGARIAVAGMSASGSGTVSVSGLSSDIWILGWSSGRPLRFTFTGLPFFSEWIEGGKEILYRTIGNKQDGYYRKYAEGDAEPVLIPMGELNPIPMDWVEDREELIYYHYSATAKRDIAAMDLETGERTPLIATPFDEMNPNVSPDGRWIAYESDESGDFEIYVRPYPEVNSGKWVVSVSGGREPLWAPDGSEVYYRDGTNFIAVPIDTSSGFSAGRPQVLFPDRYGRAIARNYDITPDGKTFVVTKAIGDEATGRQNQIFVVENWFEELERLAPHPEAH